MATELENRKHYYFLLKRRNQIETSYHNMNLMGGGGEEGEGVIGEYSEENRGGREGMSKNIEIRRRKVGGMRMKRMKRMKRKLS